VAKPAEEKASRKQHQGVNQKERRQAERAFVPPAELDQTGRERDVHEGEQRSVGVGERPQEPPVPVGGIEIEIDFEPVEGLQNDPEAQKEQKPAPPDQVVSAGEPTPQGWISVTH
jgi:hypothetical protein